MKMWQLVGDRTAPAHIIESRTLHIQERRAALARQPSDWPYRQATLVEIHSCECEIAEARAVEARLLTAKMPVETKP